MIKVFIKSKGVFGFLAGFAFTTTQQRQAGLDKNKELIERIVNVPVPVAMVVFPDSLGIGPFNDMVPCLTAEQIEDLMNSVPPPTEEELAEDENQPKVGEGFGAVSEEIDKPGAI